MPSDPTADLHRILDTMPALLARIGAVGHDPLATAWDAFAGQLTARLRAEADVAAAAGAPAAAPATTPAPAAAPKPKLEPVLAAVAEDSPDLPALRALVVEPSKPMRSLLCETLRRAKIANWTFTELTDLAAAADALKAPDNFDIVFSELEIGKASALEFLAKLRAGKKPHPLPVVIVSKETAQFRIREAEEAGATAYVTKPFSSAQLEQKVLKALEARAAASGKR